MTTTDHDVLTRCVQLAALAPSLHNSQPWRFRITGRTVELYADRSRRLDALDASGRELLISVGAALFTLRVALRSQGWTTNRTLFPEPSSPELIARLEPQRTATTPSGSVTALAGAIPQRHTNRWPFTPDVVSADTIEELTRAATAEGATLTVAGAVSRNAILGLGQVAERRLRERGGYRAELSRWTRPTPGRHDGIPPTAVGPWDAMERLPIRDFGMMHTQTWRTTERFEAYPTIAVLATHGDGPPQWVVAGQALQHVLLVATRSGLATTPISQPVEIPAIRELLTETITGRWAQMIIRMGYGPPAAATPRRPISDILEVEVPPQDGPRSHVP